MVTVTGTDHLVEGLAEEVEAAYLAWRQDPAGRHASDRLDQALVMFQAYTAHDPQAQRWRMDVCMLAADDWSRVTGR